MHSEVMEITQKGGEARGERRVCLWACIAMFARTNFIVKPAPFVARTFLRRQDILDLKGLFEG